MKKPAFLTMTLPFLIFACVLNQANTDKRKPTDIKPAWADIMKNKMATEKYSQAWGMLSSSAMEDRGQVMIYFEKGKDFGWVEYVPRNDTQVDDQFKVNGKPWKDFLAAVKKDGLKDFAKSFDGIRYEYIHLVKEKGVVKEQKRILMSNPSASNEAAEHTKLVNAFYGLVEKK